jgi:hypothetical protein
MTGTPRREISLAHLTVLDTTPPELVSVAAAAGFRTIGIRLTATPSVGVPPYDILSGGPLLRETLERLADTGVSVLDTEFLRFEPEQPVGVPEGFLEVSARLGAQNVLVMSAEPDEERTLDRSSTTHAFNQNQRFSRLEFAPAAGGLTVTTPASGNSAPPGYYLLFILNGAGVPSVGRIVQLTGTAPPPPPPPPPPVSVTLTVSKSGPGTVTSAPGGIDCGSDCTQTYPQGTTVTLDATPHNKKGRLESWGGACAGTGTCTVTLNADTTVTARFTAK